MSSSWLTLDVEGKVKKILSNVKADSREHHFGWAYITAYQLAIEFGKLFPAETETLGLKVGGKGSGEAYSLANYLAVHLSQKIKSGEIADIEGAFLSNSHLADIVFDHDPPIHALGASGGHGTLSMFRLKPHVK